MNKCREKNRFWELSTDERKELMENAIPAAKKKATNFGMRLNVSQFFWQIQEEMELSRASRFETLRNIP